MHGTSRSHLDFVPARFDCLAKNAFSIDEYNLSGLIKIIILLSPTDLLDLKKNQINHEFFDLFALFGRF